MESGDLDISKNFFPAEFKAQDVTILPKFKIWEKAKKEQGLKIVKCPCCSGYEVFKMPENVICEMCGGDYCQGCLKPCVENEVRHDHSSNCCTKLRRLIHIMSSWAENSHATTREYVNAALIFLFGNHILYTKKYFKFFQENPITDTNCVNYFFMYANLIANCFYCLTFFIAFFEFFSFLFLPAIFIPFYRRFILENWLIVLEFDVGESPITELTVRGRGYDY